MVKQSQWQDLNKQIRDFLGTMKSSNQSRNLYTPAVYGYVNESYVMKYFDEMVAAFRQIEERGYCVIADMM